METLRIIDELDAAIRRVKTLENLLRRRARLGSGDTVVAAVGAAIAELQGAREQTIDRETLGIEW